MIPLISDQVFDALVARGLVDSGEPIRRVVIDLQAGHFAIMHVEYLIDDRVLDVAHGLEGIEIKAPPYPAASGEQEATP